MNRLILVISACAISITTFAIEDIVLPPGFLIEEFADVPNARSLTLGNNGTVFASNRSGDSVFAVIPDGDFTRTITLDDGLHTPNGIAFHQGDLYVAEIDRIYRYDNIESNLDNVPDPVLLDIDLPSEKWHGWRYIGFGPDNKLYISVGAPCNICEEPGYAQIIRMNADGSERETYATGIRNSVGLAWHPETKELWFTDNGRDMLGDNLPPGELNNANAIGQDFGFPYCHAGELLDPMFGQGKDCADYRSPIQKLGPHVAPLGLTFYFGEMFPSEYHGQVFIAEHGSWNRSKKIGYRISLVSFKEGKPISYEPFATGWLQNETALEAVSGRPVDLVVLDDGSMLVSDDHAGKIYRISYASLN
ncbi:MAG: PQQ-dependent sugar dehydrogenase [Woeseiaceae bacterium]|jgi:glucose/arabinose dehydrogenase|nr:PQQ-dependent sugar dehydrogenase [Woeseiaceae bacterium]